MIGTLSAVQGAEPDPPMVSRSQSTVEHPAPPEEADPAVYLLTGTGLVAVGGIVLIGGVVGLGGLRIPGGVAMSVGRARHWAHSMRSTGAHRRRR